MGHHEAGAVSKHGDHHAQGHHHHHDHHHHAPPRVDKSVISYHIPEPAHPVADFKSPDWRIYKVENAPELLTVQNRLAKLGLRDPWLRNEVWRFDKQFGYVPRRTLLLRNVTSTLKWGFAFFVGTVLLETGYNKIFGKGDSHGHGHGHH